MQIGKALKQVLEAGHKKLYLAPLLVELCFIESIAVNEAGDDFEDVCNEHFGKGFNYITHLTRFDFGLEDYVDYINRIELKDASGEVLLEVINDDWRKHFNLEDIKLITKLWQPLKETQLNTISISSDDYERVPDMSVVITKTETGVVGLIPETKALIKDSLFFKVIQAVMSNRYLVSTRTDSVCTDDKIGVAWLLNTSVNGQLMGVLLNAQLEDFIPFKSLKEGDSPIHKFLQKELAFLNDIIPDDKRLSFYFFSDRLSLIIED